MTRIAFITADWGKVPAGQVPPPGGAGWVRIHQPAMKLAEHGHHTVVGAGVASAPNGTLTPMGHDGQPLMLGAEVVVIQRWMNDEAPDAIRAARAAGQVVIQDVDDWFWGLDPRNQAHRATSKQYSQIHNREHYKKGIEASDAVTVSTEFLGRRIRERMGARVHLIRNCVDRAMYATNPVRDTTDGLVVGWTGALAWRSGDLETMQDVLPEWLTAEGAMFVHHGLFPGDHPNAAGRLAGIPDDLIGPSKPGLIPTDYPANVAGFDIGIVPLNDVPFNHAKSWVKGLEYSAAGIPFVAQATAEYEALGCGVVAATPREWRDALTYLSDPDNRLAERAKGLAVAATHDLTTRWTDWEAVYLSELTR